MEDEPEIQAANDGLSFLRWKILLIAVHLVVVPVVALVIREYTPRPPRTLHLIQGDPDARITPTLSYIKIPFPDVSNANQTASTNSGNQVEH